MTDGIIQQVFNENIQWCKQHSTETIPVGRVENILVFLKQELIEKIKNIGFNSWDESILIGDNKE